MRCEGGCAVLAAMLAHPQPSCAFLTLTTSVASLPPLTTMAAMKKAMKAIKGMNAKKKGLRQCQGCFQWLPLLDYPLGSVYCNDDKKAVQNLRNMAVRDNEVDGFDEQLAIAHKRNLMLRKYHERVSAINATRAAGKKQNLKLPKMLEVKETVDKPNDVTNLSQAAVADQAKIT